MKYIPNSRPQLKREEAVKILDKYGLSTSPLVLIGVRGYYEDSMGAKDKNDINLYDDAMILIETKNYKTFNANTDPSFVKKNGRSLAMLNTGVYDFYRGKHKGRYNALRAYPEGVILNCTRDGKPSTCSSINIHKGGTNPSTAGVTWSEGCPSIPTPQWEGFITSVYEYMTKHGLKTVKYILIDKNEMDSIIG